MQLFFSNQSLWKNKDDEEILIESGNMPLQFEEGNFFLLSRVSHQSSVE